MEQKGCIYLITCLVNKKKYVGQHNKLDPKIRWATHASFAKRHGPYPLHCAIRYHGIDKFEFDVIYTGPLESLNLMELYFAEVHSSYVWDNNPGGYNLRMCGNFTLGTKADINKVKKYIDIEDLDNSRELSIQRRLSLMT